ncbi:MAG: ATP-binding protein [Chloroflexota bacterium]|nr:ATP-binding protein [Chloroflexota bacterium]
MLRMPDADWNTVADRIALCEEPVAWAWVALNIERAWHPVIVTVRAATSIETRFHQYSDVLLSGEQVSAADAAERFRSGSTKATGRPDLKFGPIAGRASVSWHTTEATGLRMTRSPWPRYVAEFHPNVPNTGGFILHEPLTVPGQPFYANLLAAIAEVAYGVAPPPVGGDLIAVIRVMLPTRRGRFGAIAFSDGASLVQVEEGNQGSARGLVLRAAWRDETDAPEWHRQDSTIDVAGTLALDTATIPAEMSLLLVDESGVILDRRGWGPDDADRPEDLAVTAEQVERWLSDGEGETLECKENLTSESVRRHFCQTVAALANGAGGRILLGVRKDYAIVGYPDAPTSVDQITNLIDDLVVEPPMVRVQTLVVEEKPVVVVTVRRSDPDRLPHTVDGRTYIRANSRTRPAFPSEIRAMTVRQSPPRYPGFFNM